MRPTSEELSSLSPEFDHRWSTYFANAPDKPVMLMLPLAWWVHSIFDLFIL
jgi:alcohol oxidase